MATPTRREATIEDLYRPGETAEAEPALPGWSIPVNDIMDVS